MGFYFCFILCKYFFSDTPVYIQSREPSDFSDINNIQYLSDEFSVQESYFKQLPTGAFVVLDDFSFKQAKNKAQDKLEFLKIVNYYLRHNKITLILVIHNLYNNNLFLYHKSSEIVRIPNLCLFF